jgi:hypothetical protein
MQHAAGKKDRQKKIKLIKTLVNTGASESVMTLEKGKGLPLSSNAETKKWSTTAGVLKTSAKTKRLEFSLPEL